MSFRVDGLSHWGFNLTRIHKVNDDRSCSLSVYVLLTRVIGRQNETRWYPTWGTDVVAAGSSGLGQLWTLCPNLLFLNFRRRGTFRTQLWTLCPNLLFLNFFFWGGVVLCRPNFEHCVQICYFWIGGGVLCWPNFEHCVQIYYFWIFGGGGVLYRPNLSCIKSEVSDNFHFREGGGGPLCLSFGKVSTFLILSKNLNHCRKLLLHR